MSLLKHMIEHATVAHIVEMRVRKVIYVQMQQYISSIARCNPIAFIVCDSALLPVYPTQTSLPKALCNNSNICLDNVNNSHSLNAISDSL